MALFRFLFALSSLIAVSSLAFIDRFMLTMFTVLAEPFRITPPAPSGLSLSTSAGSIDSALFHDNRHEAGVSRRAAARNV